MNRMYREEIALGLLRAIIEREGAQGEKQVREAFELAKTFEKVSDEFGMRSFPTPGVKRRRPGDDEQEDD